MAGQYNCPHGCPHQEEPVYDSDGYNQQGFHRDTGLDRSGNPFDPYADDSDEGLYTHLEDEDGYGMNGFGRHGFNIHGYDINGLDRRAFDVNGYDVHGYDEQGFDR